MALDYFESTHTTVFLLQQIRQEAKKQLAIVAPTGLAAINTGGILKRADWTSDSSRAEVAVFGERSSDQTC